MSANRLNDGNPGLQPLMVTIPGWEVGKEPARLEAETRRDLWCPCRAKSGSWDKETEEDTESIA